jgi:transposase-like protein
MSLFNFQLRFPDDDSCWAFLESIVWPNGPVCPRCGSIANSAPWKPRPHRWQCRACKAQFRVASETALAGRHLSMHRWFVAIYLVATDPHLTSVELAEHLSVWQSTAWSVRERVMQMMITDGALLRAIVSAAKVFGS